MSQVLPYDEVEECTYSLNSKQREAFKVVHTWEKDFVKNDRQNVKPIPIFLSGSGETGKPYLVKVIYNVI